MRDPKGYPSLLEKKQKSFFKSIDKITEKCYIISVRKKKIFTVTSEGNKD